MFEVFHDYNLKMKNNFRCDSVAKKYIEFDDIDDLMDELEGNEGNVLVLGEGSNILLAKDIEGVVIRSKRVDFKIVKEENHRVFVKVGSGLNWDKWVGIATSRGWRGIENLSKVPGSVGGAVVQNIGAYGIEVSSCIEKVYCIDIDTKIKYILSAKDCNFSYRKSIFKDNASLLITDVQFSLNKTVKLCRGYRGIVNLLSVMSLLLSLPSFKKRALLDHSKVRNFVSEKDKDPARNRLFVSILRKLVMPDPLKRPNAGCFFKSPIVSRNEYEKIKENIKGISVYDEGDYLKISAGDLIKSLGLNGNIINGVEIDKKRPLIIINRSQASGKEILEVCQEIKNKIYTKFSLNIDFEVVVYK